MHIHAILTHNNACNNCKSDNIPYIILKKNILHVYFHFCYLEVYLLMMILLYLCASKK